MLDVIGAGATATTTQNWSDVWNKSPEANQIQKEVNDIHENGRRNNAGVETALHSEFATSWGTQFITLIKRDALYRYRNPTYLLAKLILNITGGLLIGVSDG